MASAPGRATPVEKRGLAAKAAGHAGTPSSASARKNFCACQIALKLRPKLNETNNLRQINLYTHTETHTQRGTHTHLGLACKLLKYQSVICLSADSVAVVSDVIVIGFITHTPHVHQQFSWPHLHRGFCCFSTPSTLPFVPPAVNEKLYIERGSIWRSVVAVAPAAAVAVAAIECHKNVFEVR